VTLVAAVLGHWLVQRRFRAAAGFVAASVLLVGGWLLWSASGPPGLPGQSYIADALYRPPPEAWVGDSARPTEPASEDSLGPQGSVEAARPGLLRAIADRVIRNFREYARTGVPAAFAFPGIRNQSWDNVLWLAVLLVAGGLGLLELWRRLPAGVLLLSCYGSLLLLWPYPLERFLAPVIPLGVATVLLGIRRGSAALAQSGRLRWLIPGIVAGLLVVSALAINGRRLRAARTCNREAPYVSPGCYTSEQRGFFAAVREAERILPRGAVLLTPKPATVHWLTGLRAVDQFRATSLTPDSLRSYLREQGAELILLSQVLREQRWLAERLVPQCREWVLSAELVAGALLLRRAGPGEPHSGDDPASCTALRRFAYDPW
jgi:hypothetical protein